MKGTTIAVALVSLALAASTGMAQTVTQRVTKREVRQQARINQGVKNGELTKREAVKLEAQQAKINRDKKQAKADGVVTPQERAKLTREQNRASKNIYIKKHNKRVR